MSWRIFRSSVLLAVVILLLSVLTFYGILHEYYENEFFSELEIGAAYVRAGVESVGASYFEGLESQDRVTWVAADGTVLYDSAADPAVMENHLDREEIAGALEQGFGRSTHVSRTMLQKTLYYALRCTDGTVVRVARVSSSVSMLILGTLPPICFVAAAALLIAGLLSFRLSRRILEPIRNLDPETPADAAYEELRPLIRRMQQQKRTIRRQMEELEQKNRDFSALVDNMREGVLLADRRGAILFCSRSFLALAGQEASEATENVFRMPCRPELKSLLEGALAGRDGEEILEVGKQHYRVTVSPIWENGHAAGMVAIALDVTEQVQRELLRQEFSAVVSHELKTPLTSISGFAELMASGMADSEKMKEFSGDIYRESRRLIALTDDLLRLSRLDAGGSGFEEQERVELYALAEDILENLRPAAAAMGVSLQLEGERAWVTGIWQVLNEMLYNLCDNAIKYNRPGGSVTVRVEAPGGALVRVSDTGIGIPREEQHRVFERFYRVDKSHSRQLGGTGLGLSIVKHAAQYHGAKLNLESEPGVGTEITVQFPAEDKEKEEW